MKTHTSLFSCIVVMMLTTTFSFATIRTVSNDSSHPAQFTTVQAALDVSVNGDTIYVHGSNATYDDFTIRKRVVIFGAGYNPVNQFNQATRVGNISLFRDAGSNDASGSVISGFLASSLGYASGSLSLSNITVFRNKFTYILYTYAGGGYGDKWYIYNNVLTYVYGGAGGPLTHSSTNISIQNNIIIGNVSNFSESSVIVDHNLFLNNSNITNCYYTVFSNNIFVRTSGDIMSNVIYSSFSNNLSNQNTIGPASQYSPTNSFVATYVGSGGGANTGAGNIVGQDPLFQSVSDVNNYVSSADYHLKAASPGKNASTDGTDIGIYGGAYPFPSGGSSGSGFETSPTPPVPQVTQVDIQNATVAPNGTLQVKVQAKVNN